MAVVAGVLEAEDGDAALLFFARFTGEGETKVVELASLDIAVVVTLARPSCCVSLTATARLVRVDRRLSTGATGEAAAFIAPSSPSWLDFVELEGAVEESTTVASEAVC